MGTGNIEHETSKYAALFVRNLAILMPWPCSTTYCPTYKPTSLYDLQIGGQPAYDFNGIVNGTFVTVQGTLTVPSQITACCGVLFDGDVAATAIAVFSCQSGVAITVTPNNPYCSVTTYYAPGCFAAGGIVCTNITPVMTTGCYDVSQGQTVVCTATSIPIVTTTVTTVTQSSLTTTVTQTTSTCTSTITITLTSGQPIPPLSPLPNGACYAFVTAPSSMQLEATGLGGVLSTVGLVLVFRKPF